MFLKGNSKDVHTALLRGLELAERLNDPYQQLRMHGALHIFMTRSGDFHASDVITRRSMAVAAATGDHVITAMAEWLVTVSYHVVGDQKNAQFHGEAALRHPAVPAHRIQLGYDYRVRGMSALSRALWLRGYGERAVQVAWQTIEEAGHLNHPVSLLIGLLYAGEVLLWYGDWAGGETVVERAISHAERHSLAPYQAIGLGLKGKLAIRLGDAASGIPLLRACLQTLHANHHETLTTSLAGLLVEGLLMTGQHQEAASVIDAAVAQCERAAGSFYDPEIWRLKGCVLESAPQPDPVGAEAWFQRAIERAREQSALSWELRAITSLARLYRTQGRSAAGRQELGAVLDRVTEGSDAVDIRAATHLLGELQDD
jgi:predicted ATPase